jgi:hypothetical protein
MLRQFLDLGVCRKGKMKTRQIPDDLYDWINARTFAIGAEMLPTHRGLLGTPVTTGRNRTGTKKKRQEQNCSRGRCGCDEPENFPLMAESFSDNS